MASWLRAVGNVEESRREDTGNGPEEVVVHQVFMHGKSNPPPSPGSQQGGWYTTSYKTRVIGKFGIPRGEQGISGASSEQECRPFRERGKLIHHTLVGT